MKKHPRLKVKAYCYIEKKTTATVLNLNYEEISQDKKYPGIHEARFWKVFSDFILFIDVNEADQKQKKALRKWLTGQTCPLIPGVEWACYPSDYNRFIDAFWEGRIAIVND
jgi:hypothetical protein